MNRFRSVFIFTLAIVLLFGCKGKDGAPGPTGAQGPVGPQGPIGQTGATDKQIRIPFATGLWQAFSTGYYPLPEATYVLKFNKSYYSQVDSIVFVAQIQSPDPKVNGIAQLVNITDNKPIESSIIKSSSTAYTITVSKNIYQELPDKEITLGIQAKSEKEDIIVNFISFSLFLYRK